MHNVLPVWSHMDPADDQCCMPNCCAFDDFRGNCTDAHEQVEKPGAADMVKEAGMMDNCWIGSAIPFDFHMDVLSSSLLIPLSLGKVDQDFASSA